MPQYTAPPQQQVTRQPSQTSASGYKIPAERESDAQLRVGDLQGDISYSSDIPSEAINRPIQSITVETFGQKVTQEQRAESPGILSDILMKVFMISL